jgi:hypothetical protein
MVEPGYKLPPDYINFIDVIFYSLANKLDGTFSYLGMTPNELTTISLCFGLLSVYFVSISNFFLGAIFYLFSYAFDCFDGFYARKHNKQTVFGDWYDHITDWLIVILLIYVIYKNHNINTKTKIIAFTGFILLLALTIIYVGCEEKYNNTDNPSLKIFQNVCQGNVNNNLNSLKNVSLGSMTLYIVIVLNILQF